MIFGGHQGHKGVTFLIHCSSLCDLRDETVENTFTTTPFLRFSPRTIPICSEATEEDFAPSASSDIRPKARYTPDFFSYPSVL